ncbi:MAG: hypothetical protein LQ347_003288 [Umbilicaria vellea]|nr:MAG: hypothetical protein LQ347_003288 [Umbilicaria vellea]
MAVQFPKKKSELEFLKTNLSVFSNAKNHRRNPLVPLVVPTVNLSHFDIIPHQQKSFGQKKGFLICNSNCAVIGIVIPFAAIQARFGLIDQVSVVTMQAVSGAGYPGVSSMDILDNVVPFISGEEDKLETETQKILGTVSRETTSLEHQLGLKISAACNRVAVLDDHTETWTSQILGPELLANSVLSYRKKHQKRLSAPSHWLLDKLSGAYAPRPSPGPHKLRDCMPLIVFIRNRLKYALNSRETKAIVMQRLIKVDGKVRTDTTYPAGFMDVISIEKTGENFRLVYDTKGRFTVHRIQTEEAEYKLGKVKRVQLGKGGIPYLVTHDARTIRYPDPAIKVNDTVKIDLATGKITEFIRFDTGVIAMATGGRNMGRVGVITHRERHDGGFNIVHIKDAIDNSFATRESNVFVIGREKPWISLPKGKGVKLSIAEERDRRRAFAIAS